METGPAHADVTSAGLARGLLLMIQGQSVPNASNMRLIITAVQRTGTQRWPSRSEEGRLHRSQCPPSRPRPVGRELNRRARQRRDSTVRRVTGERLSPKQTPLIDDETGKKPEQRLPGTPGIGT
ncbi:hypothetical protein SKAU_G00343550 [Synaphobranchus kaupii]|uniref:Uncharacterized protein n=1 Tax=Synaphobranchus kaupii TaxID=118154 RepID=A0A9Q1IH90_SYNKA|nr:hypothetical protein SKAU_G00343550 [Synaphobranchus kaupii]